MRLLNKSTISRRTFLKTGTVTALGLTIMGPMIIGKDKSWAATFSNIGRMMLLLLSRWREIYTLTIF